MIVTHKPRVPWWWVTVMTLPWGATYLLALVNDQAVTFTIRKFTPDPSLIALLCSVNLMTNVLVGAPASYMSDRIWTPWGRRRPFIIGSRLGSALLLLLVPFMPSLWVFALFNIVLQAVIDLGTPAESLYFEIIPQPQRGRAVAMRHIFMGLCGVFFTSVLLANFDRSFAWRLPALPTLHCTGEQLVYVVTAVALLGIAALYMFFVRETPVHSSLVGQSFHLRAYLRDVFGDHRWHAVYMLYVVPTFIKAGTAAFIPLLITDRFGYSKAQMAKVMLPLMLTQLAVIAPLIGWLADRLPRIRIMQCGLLGTLGWVIGYWLYLRFCAPGGVPSLFFIFGYGLIGEALTTTTAVPAGALLFDLIPSNRMGTLSSGFGLINSFLMVVFMNACGFFIRIYSRLFYPANRIDSSKYDYTALYLFQALMAAGGVALFLYFLRQYKRGKVIEYGKLEEQAEEKLAAAPPTEPIALPE